MIASGRSSTQWYQGVVRQAFLGWRKMHNFRQVAFRLKRNMAGSQYGRGQRVGRPANLLYQIATILTPNLITGAPKTHVKAETPGFQAGAELNEMAVNYVMKRIAFRDTMRAVVQDALCGIGCLKTAMMPSGEPDGWRGTTHHSGMPYSDRVSLDDLIIDPMARNTEEAYLIGNRYRLPLWVIQESGLYDPRAFVDLVRSDQTSNEVPTERQEYISASFDSQKHAHNDFLNLVELMDIWIPTDGIVVTVPFNEASQIPLRVVDWEGPNEGPYDFMSFYDLNDNCMPIAPLSIVHDLDLAANEAMRKVIRRMQNMKHNLLYRRGSDDDAQSVADASDLETIAVDNPQDLNEVTFNGPDQESYSHIGFLTSWASELTGNTELLGGNQAAAPTLGQEQILLANSNIRVTDMRDRVNVTGAAVGRKISWFLHYDPFVKIPLVRRLVEGLEIPTEYSADTREGDWLDFHHTFEFSAEPMIEPQVKAGRQMQWATEVVPTAMNLAMMTQGAFPAMKFIRMMGKMMGVDELDGFNMDEERLAQVMLMNQAYPEDPKGQVKQNMTGHTSGAPQMAGGARDSQTVNNGKFSSNSQAGAMTASSGR